MTPHLLMLIQDATPPRANGTLFLVQMVLFVGIIYFLMIRPKMKQEKRHRERLTQLRKGDEVVTAGGIVGKIIALSDREVTLRSGESRFQVVRERIAEIRGAEDAESKS